MQLVEKYDVRLIRHDCNKGLGAVRNTGVTAASHELVAAIDADCIIDKNWLCRCLPFFENNKLVGVGGRMDESFCSLADQWRARNLVQHFGEDEKQVSFLSGSNTIFKKAALLSAGLYDESFRCNHEDTDISRRLIDHGGQLMYVPQAKAVHIKQDTLYSVMRSCWGFRHPSFPHTLFALACDILKEVAHSLSILFRSILSGQWHLLPLDSLYFFIQCHFSLKAFVLKTAHF